MSSQETLLLEPNSQKERILNQTLTVNTQKEETQDSASGTSVTKPLEGETLGSATPTDETPGMCGTENIDDDGSIMEKSFSVPSFLRKVFQKELGEGGVSDHKLLVIAVHAVLLESGFVGIDSVSGMKVERLHVPDEWPSPSFTMSLWYTLPEIIDHSPSRDFHGVENVVLKFLSMGKYIVVCGSLAKNGSWTYRVCLDEDRLAFLLNLMWANRGSVDAIMNEEDNFSNLNHEREVFEFWKTVKDRLTLPLLIDLCERAGLAPPPSFIRLPAELKLKVLEFLPGVDVAKAGCVCSELRYLSSNEDLWRQKFVEQFGNTVGSARESHWKTRFAQSCEERKRRRTSVKKKLLRAREESLFLLGYQEQLDMFLLGFQEF